MSIWKKCSLHEVAEIERDSIEASAITDGTLYVGLENIESGGRFVNVRSVANGELASNKFTFTERHVLYGKLRPYLAKIARPSFDGICSTDILPILPGSDLDRDYLTHFLRQPTMIELANSRAAGANLPRLSPKVLAEFEIPLPPLAEQRRIAAILDQAEALRAKRRHALAQLDTLTHSLFLLVHRSGKCEATEVPLADVAEPSRGSFVNGPFGSDLLTSELQDVGVPVVYIRDIRDGEYRRVSTAHVSERKAHSLAVCQVMPGDVLVAKVGDPPGISAVYPSDEPLAIATQDVIRIRVNPSIAVPEFLSCYLNSSVGQWLIKQITLEATRARFSLGDFKRMRIALPPLPCQREFSAQVSAVERLKAVQRASLAKLDALFASLQHRAFRGEL